MRFRNKLHKEFEQLPIVDSGLEPVVYTGMQKQTTVIVFNDYFEYITITKLINKIESIRQTGGYTNIDIYFSSLGGDADYLFVLSNFLNNLKDIHINFIVTGMVASAGFYILLLIENPNIDIIFNKRCSGSIHLGDTLISYRGQLSSESSRYKNEKFHAKSLEKLNEYFKNELIPKLNLSKKDIEQINEGNDVMFHSDELEKIISEYHEKRYFNSNEAVDEYTLIKQKIYHHKKVLSKMRDGFKKYANLDIENTLGIDTKDEFEDRGDDK